MCQVSSTASCWEDKVADHHMIINEPPFEVEDLFLWWMDHGLFLQEDQGVDFNTLLRKRIDQINLSISSQFSKLPKS